MDCCSVLSTHLPNSVASLEPEPLWNRSVSLGLHSQQTLDLQGLVGGLHNGKIT